jgi:Tol biopolymer transport system component
MWVDRQGKSEPLWEDRQDFRNPRFSPDGRFLATGVVTDGTGDIWVLDLERDVPTRLTFHEGNDSGPVWTPDGRYVLFSSDREGSFDIYRKRADGSGDAERLTDMEQDEFVWSTSPYGKVLAYTVDSPETFSDLWLLPEDGEPEPFLVTPAIEVAPVFSPDGLWIAYFTNESGNWNVFVRGVDGSGKWQISSDGGAWPWWSGDGKELFFFWAGGLSRATIDAGPEGFRAGRPEEISREQWASQLQAMPYAVEPNGERFVTLLGEASRDPDHHEHLSLVLNWFDELERTFATSP